MPPNPPASLWTRGYHCWEVKASVKVHVTRGVLGTPPKKKKPPAKPAGLHSLLMEVSQRGSVLNASRLPKKVRETQRESGDITRRGQEKIHES